MVAKLITPAELAAAGGRRGIVALRQLAGLAEPTRSATERAFLRAVKEAAPDRQLPYMVEGLGRIKPDFRWARQRVIVETDAFGTHGHASAFESDRERDVALSVLGWLVLRFTRRQVVAAPRRVTTRVAQALALRGASISL